MRVIDRICTMFESGLMIAQYIPGVHIVSAVLRAKMGKVQIVAGLILAGAFGVASQFQTNCRKKRELEDLAITWLEYAAHGVLNITRAVASLLYVTNIGFIFYDSDAFELGKFNYGFWDKYRNDKGAGRHGCQSCQLYRV